MTHIPLLNPQALGRHHFPASFELNPSPNEQIFHISRLETYNPHIQYPLPPHRKTVHCFIYLTHGRTKRAKGLHEYEIGSDTFFFMPAGQIITADEPISTDAQGYYCHFDVDLLTRGFIAPEALGEMPFLQFTGRPLVEVPPPAQGRIIHLLEQLVYNEQEPDGAAALELAKIYLLTLFFELKRFVHAEAGTAQTAAVRITQAYKDALAQHIYQLQTVSAYAELLALTPNHLNKCVKFVTGKSAQDGLDDIVLLEAKSLLKQTNLSIAEIAFKLGKEAQSSFSRFFKSKTGQTPRAYRLTGNS